MYHGHRNFLPADGIDLVAHDALYLLHRAMPERQVTEQSPDANCRRNPARNSSRWLSDSTSAGASRSVCKKSLLMRMGITFRRVRTYSHCRLLMSSLLYRASGIAGKLYSYLVRSGWRRRCAHGRDGREADKEERGPEPVVPGSGPDGEAGRLRAGARDVCHKTLRVSLSGRGYSATSTTASKLPATRTPTSRS